MAELTDSYIGRNMDRISGLPDSILSHILSFLPTKYVVGTSILSRRWQYVWASVPNFDFDDTFLLQERNRSSNDRKEELVMSFVHFVDRVLILTDVSCFQKVRFSLQRLQRLKYNLEFLKIWVCAVIKRNVQDLYLSYDSEFDGFYLPRMLFTSKTLVALDLNCSIILDVPPSVCLPSLKILHLMSIRYENEDSIQKLFSGCPVLEKLILERSIFYTRQSFHISVPTLKDLEICSMDDVDEELSDESDDSEGIIEYDIPRCKLVVDTPNLESMCLIDYVSEEFLMMNVSSLLDAYVEVGHRSLRSMNSHRRYNDCICQLLTRVANIKVLSLVLLPIFFFARDRDLVYVIPIFHNLNRLELDINDEAGWKLLRDFLECSPKLEVLVIKQGCKHLETANILWSPPQQVPNCLLLHMKKIEITQFDGKEYELKAIKYLLKNAEVLKMMTINCRDYKIKKELYYCRKVAGFRRGSKTCQLNFS